MVLKGIVFIMEREHRQIRTVSQGERSRFKIGTNILKHHDDE
jgi:hypothetical protein